MDRKVFPQGLKPTSFLAFYGAAEKPRRLQKPFMDTV